MPAYALLDQWLVSLLDKLNVPRDEIAVFYGKEKDYLNEKKFIPYVINSAREYIQEHA